MALAQNHRLPVCGTSEAVEASLAANPELRENLRRLEAETRAAEQARQEGRVAAPGDPFLVIPVVFHIVHNFGPENISDAQVADAMRILNEDFARRARDTNNVSARFRPIMGTTNLEFRLARRDPQGNCTNGITRTQSALTSAASDNVKDLISWDTRRYLNIWVVSRIASGAGGYAYYPGTAPRTQYEGIVVLASQAGSIGASGGSNFAARTLTHEVGHYFNLPHTWGNSNSPGSASNCNIDDGVQDTPNTVGVSDQSCPLNMSDCGPIANVENYMDYANCGRMFTQGQSVRMRTAANSTAGGRSTLWSAANLAFTGLDTPRDICAPEVSFSIARATTCPNTPVEVTGVVELAPQDTSLRIRWSFPGGTPATATTLRAQVSYPVEGYYPITFTAFNRNGLDSVRRDTAVLVSGNQAPYTLGVVEDFEAPAFPQAGSNPFNRWQFEGVTNTAGWAPSSISGFLSTRSLRILPSGYQGGTVVSAITAGYDLRNLSANAVLQFKLASARRNATNSDRLTVASSVNCGRNFTVRILRQGTDRTTGAYTSQALFAGAFRPTASDWRTERIPLRQLVGNADVRFRFELTAGGGNNFFIDSLVVLDPSAVTSVLGRAGNGTLLLAPNPADGYLEVTLPGTGLASYQVTDATGRRLLAGTTPQANLRLATEALPAGAYLLRLEQDGQAYHQRFIVEHRQ